VNQAGPRVLALYDQQDACFAWRVQQPFEALARAGYRYAAYAHKDEARIEQYAHLYDAVLLPRLSWADRVAGRQFVDALHRAGLAVLGEFDDDVFSPAVNVRLGQTTMAEADPETLERKRLDRLAALRSYDGATVSSRRLRSVVEGFVAEHVPVAVVPNAIDTVWWRQALRGARRQVAGLTVGWFGGARLDIDFGPVAEAWGRVAARYPAVTFVVLGYQPPILSEHLPPERILRIPWQPLAQYPQALRQIDISCCVVSPRVFNTAKTPIKVWESTLAGAVCVASPTLYGAVVAHGEDGLLAETVDEWEAALSELIESPALRRRLYRAQRRRTATEHSLQANLWRWPAAWSRIVSAYRERQARPRLYLPAGVGA
jgi:glycosyltransferase involved in cell wall biosynthesis